MSTRRFLQLKIYKSLLNSEILDFVFTLPWTLSFPHYLELIIWISELPASLGTFFLTVLQRLTTYEQFSISFNARLQPTFNYCFWSPSYISYIRSWLLLLYLIQLFNMQYLPHTKRLLKIVHFWNRVLRTQMRPFISGTRKYTQKRTVWSGSDCGY